MTKKSQKKTRKPTVRERYLMSLLNQSELTQEWKQIARGYRNKERLRMAALEHILRSLVASEPGQFERALDASPLMPLPSKEPKGTWGEMRYAFKTEIAAGEHPRKCAMVPQDKALDWAYLVRRYRVSNAAQLRWAKPFFEALRAYVRNEEAPKT